MKLEIFHYKLLMLLLVGALFLSSCKKYLDKKPNTNIIQPSTLTDFQNLLDNTNVMNITGTLPQLSSDEYYIPDFTAYQALGSLTLKNAYVWAKDIYGGTTKVPDWNQLYTTIFYANNVLEGLDNLIPPSSEQQTWNILKGSAFFYRAYAMYDLVRNFSSTYDSTTASSSLGVPIRLSAGIDVFQPRATVQQTYSQIFSDLQEAKLLLNNPLNSTYNNRPSKPAVYALLSRIYLSMGDYAKAEKNADSCLALYNTLINYNTLNVNATSPFVITGKETIFFSSQLAYSAYSPIAYASNISAIYAVDTTLLKMYDANDLRFSAYFLKVNSIYRIKRIYTIALQPFTGLATDEIYLNKAECAARRSDISTAMNYLNTLLINRYKAGTFIPLSATTSSDALSKVLNERRKELVWRSLRWSDLKRLNDEGNNITLTRVLNGQGYQLPPNSPRYIFPIPDDEISLSGISQNPR